MTLGCSTGMASLAVVMVISMARGGYWAKFPKDWVCTGFLSAISAAIFAAIFADVSAERAGVAKTTIIINIHLIISRPFIPRVLAQWCDYARAIRSNPLD